MLSHILGHQSEPLVVDKARSLIDDPHESAHPAIIDDVLGVRLSELVRGHAALVADVG